MAAGINKITLLGNLGSQPEVTFMPNGKAVLNISLFSDESYFNDQNVKVETGEWHKLAIFGGQAETIGKHCNKGDQLYVEGKNRTRDYEKDGEKRYVTEVVVKEFRFGRSSGGATNSQGQSNGQAAYNSQPQPAAQPQPAPVIGFYEANGAPMTPVRVQEAKAAGFPNGWQHGWFPPQLAQQQQN